MYISELESRLPARFNNFILNSTNPMNLKLLKQILDINWLVFLHLQCSKLLFYSVTFFRCFCRSAASSSSLSSSLSVPLFFAFSFVFLLFPVSWTNEIRFAVLFRFVLSAFYPRTTILFIVFNSRLWCAASVGFLLFFAFSLSRFFSLFFFRFSSLCFIAVFGFSHSIIGRVRKCAI